MKLFKHIVFLSLLLLCSIVYFLNKNNLNFYSSKYNNNDNRIPKTLRSSSVQSIRKRTNRHDKDVNKMHRLLSKNWIDGVVVASISDKDVFLNFALESYFRNCLGLRYIYVICNAPLCLILKKRKRQSKQKQKFWSRVFIVPEDEEGLFPFKLQDVKRVRIKAQFEQQAKEGLHIKNWNGWTYQQLLKIYSVIVLSKKKQNILHKRPKILPTVLIVDADTVFVKQISFLRNHNQYWYSVSSDRTGAFPTDALLGSEHLKNLHGLNSIENKNNQNKCDNTSIIPKVLISGNTKNIGLINRGRDGAYTSITHHSIFQKDVIELLLYRLQNQTCGFECSSYNNCPCKFFFF
jgi:hypothetical protein